MIFIISHPDTELLFVLTVWIPEVFEDPVKGSKSYCLRHCTHTINLWPQRNCRMGYFSVFVSQQCSDVFPLSLSLTIQSLSAKPIFVISSRDAAMLCVAHS